jgi:hypothetical protein
VYPVTTGLMPNPMQTKNRISMHIGNHCHLRQGGDASLHAMLFCEGGQGVPDWWHEWPPSRAWGAKTAFCICVSFLLESSNMRFINAETQFC